MEKHCTHLNEIKDVQPRSDGCEDCLKVGDTWMQLRMCMSCGYVGCCNSSKNKHASKHYLATNHPVMKSLSLEDAFTWCYVDEVYL
jgi:uncharacterized UBP type Zn finger protein